MSDLGNLLFVLVCVGFLLHEMDAVHEREWRLLFGLRAIRDETRARAVFIWLHLPLLVVIAALVTHGDPAVRTGARLALEAFALVHAALHARIRARGSGAFASLSSRLIIHGTALVGALALTVRFL